MWSETGHREPVREAPNWNRDAVDQRDGRSRDWRTQKMALPAKMGTQVAIVLYVVVMAAVIVGVDFAFFRNRFWERLTVNIGIVLVFGAFYFRFLRRS
jgi:protein-S-isoprenylcysteine O-methyltransferase Ste14